MIYHLNANLGTNLTGIEHAAIKRLKLFRNCQPPSKILTIRHNIDLHNIIKIIDVKEHELENMYDYFQNAQQLKEKKQKINDFFPVTSYTFEKVPGSFDYRVFKEGVFIAYVHCLMDNETVSYINYFDSKRRKVKRSLYDCRGFLSCEKFLGEKQRVLTEQFYTPYGEKTIEKFYQIEEEKSVLTMIRVKDRQRNWHSFSSEEEFIFFYLETILTDKEDIVIVDRNILFDKPLIKLNKKVKKIAILHSRHVKGEDYLSSRISAPYTDIFSNLDKFDMIITSTESQRRDIIERFHNPNQLYCIPVGYREEREEQISMTNPLKVSVVARYYVEKRLDHIIQAFAKVIKEIPEAELHLFGFGDVREQYKTEKELRKQVSNLGLENSVKFRGYLSDLSKEYQTTRLFVLTSKVEGFCLALLEAISHGIPAISYDIKYGPSELIEHEKSGYLLSQADPDQLAEKMVKLLANHELYQQFSRRAYAKSFEFSDTVILEKWRNVLEDINYVSS